MIWLLVVLRFTVPAYEASAPCTTSPTLERIASVRLYRDGLLIDSHPTSAGPDSFTVSNEADHTFCVATVDSAGNQAAMCAGSCASFQVTAVPPSSFHADSSLYDIAGRKVHSPAAGVYFTRSRKIVILK